MQYFKLRPVEILVKNCSYVVYTYKVYSVKLLLLLKCYLSVVCQLSMFWKTPPVSFMRTWTFRCASNWMNFVFLSNKVSRMYLYKLPGIFKHNQLCHFLISKQAGKLPSTEHTFRWNQSPLSQKPSLPLRDGYVSRQNRSSLVNMWTRGTQDPVPCYCH